MSRFEAWWMHTSNVLVGGTGLIYAWMLYLARPADPYAVVNHPWQPQVQHLHVLAAPALVFAVGLIWQRHIWSHWRRGIASGRRTGLSMALTLVPMVASGYLLQTAVDDDWRRIWVIVHLTASALWIAGTVAHQLPGLIWRKPRSGGGHADPAAATPESAPPRPSITGEDRRGGSPGAAARQSSGTRR